jgi:tRNA dimethylallyltransferase
MCPAYPVVVITGPTASGKTDLALCVSQAVEGEIVNFDSVQVFRRFDIGTAKPSKQERLCVPHHLFDILEPSQACNAGDYQRRARAVLGDIRNRGTVPILVGGTGLYLRAVMEGLFDGPSRSAYWRRRMEGIADSKGREHLHLLLARMDPSSAERIAPRDLPKVIRALEVRLSTGRSLSAHLHEKPRRPIAGFDFRIFGLAPPRSQLFVRIEERVRRMFAAGLVDEVRAILESGVSPRAHAFRAIGYPRVLEYIDGAISLDEAIMLTERDTRRYAKRQMTWFRKQPGVCWSVGFGDEKQVQNRIQHLVDDFLNTSRLGSKPENADDQSNFFRGVP